MLVNQLQHWGLRRGRAVLLSVFFLLAIIIGFVWLIIPPFINQFEQLVRLVPEGIDKLINRVEEITTNIDPDLIESLPSIQEFLGQLQPIFNQIVNRGLNVFYSSLGSLLSLLLLLALTLMLLVNPLPYRQGFIRLFPAFYRQKVDNILKFCDQALCGWLKTIFCHIILMTIGSWLGLLILGIPLAFSQGLLSGLFMFIPNFGFILGMIPPLAIALLEAAWWKPWAVIILYSMIYIAIQQLDSRFLMPQLLKRHINLVPGITFIAQIFFASSLGLLGLVLALPLLIVGQIWVREALVKGILDEY
jgi:predicted PurR-regulated permease PerM